jgi:hypothetical protein
VNRTPLRLVAIEEALQAEDENICPAEEQQSGAPVMLMNEQAAITRRVPESEIIASMDTFRDSPKRSSKSKILLAVGAAAVVITVIVFTLAMRGKGAATPAPVSAIHTPVPSPAESPQPLPALAPPAPALALPPRSKPIPEIIRLVVAADPMEAELSLDGNVLAGHRLNLEVPKDPGIHVVSASAPGYIPFNQQVSFSRDVVLKISLHRAHMPPARQAAKSRPSPIESGPKSNTKPAALSPGPGLAPGMTLDGPSVRSSAKPIDERNPYKP